MQHTNQHSQNWNTKLQLLGVKRAALCGCIGIALCICASRWNCCIFWKVSCLGSLGVALPLLWVHVIFSPDSTDSVVTVEQTPTLSRPSHCDSEQATAMQTSSHKTTFLQQNGTSAHTAASHVLLSHWSPWDSKQSPPGVGQTPWLSMICIDGFSSQKSWAQSFCFPKSEEIVTKKYWSKRQDKSMNSHFKKE